MRQRRVAEIGVGDVGHCFGGSCAQGMRHSVLLPNGPCSPLPAYATSTASGAAA